MTATDDDGTEWLPVLEAARAVRVRRSTIDNWTSRGTVRKVRIRGRVWVHMGDVRHAEAAWVRRARDSAATS